MCVNNPCVEVVGQLCGVSLFFHFLHSRDQAYVVSLLSKHLSLLSHLTRPECHCIHKEATERNYTDVYNSFFIDFYLDDQLNIGMEY